ncbi:imidazolonepropionase [Selenomonas ruminis]|uniref:Imidazolonepropionase n=1 Tax=Selenomonas ruminis TaxID=2593411 RepID=A0A5D6WEK9_9FIRM|nr:imidazolonepropionase [Selenomonas sp. mPRGC5]TYZ24874.1 imidazolonepropionase [Selenomonas sp. mPRGC5]
MEQIVLRHIQQIATPEGKTERKGKEMNQLHLIADGAIWIEQDRIRMVGTDKEVMAAIGEKDAIQWIDGSGKCAIPGFVDAHTHFLFAGSRAEEFDDRLAGVPYLELLARGGGICSTMQAVRETSEEELFHAGKKILQDMLRYGITTVEGKSGYGLNREDELKQLRVMRRLDKDLPLDIVSTYLGGHAVPPEYREDSDGYVDFMLEEMLPLIKKEGLADFVDVFCEQGVFSLEQSRRILTRAKALGFAVKLHADEMSSMGGAGLAHELGAVSADHLLSIRKEDILRLSTGNTKAVLLPATAFCMRCSYAPARELIAHDVAVALASDFNPGSCFTYSTALLFALAVIQMRLTSAETLTAMTLNGAAALNRAAEIGSIEAGKKADILLLAAPDYRFLAYQTGMNLVQQVIKDGKLVWNLQQ